MLASKPRGPLYVSWTCWTSRTTINTMSAAPRHDLSTYSVALGAPGAAATCSGLERSRRALLHFQVQHPMGVHVLGLTQLRPGHAGVHMLPLPRHRLTGRARRLMAGDCENGGLCVGVPTAQGPIGVPQSAL